MLFKDDLACLGRTQKQLLAFKYVVLLALRDISMERRKLKNIEQEASYRLRVQGRRKEKKKLERKV